MPRMFIPFGDYDPAHEHGRAEAGALLRLENAVPAWGGYRSLPKLVDGDDMVTGTPTLLHSAYFHEPLMQHYFGGAGNSNLLMDINQSNGLIRDISRTVGGAYSNSSYVWKFASFGDDVWAYNGADHPQRRTAGAGNFANGIASTLIPLPRCGAAVRGFMVVGGLGSPGSADEIAWSDDADATWFDDKTGTRAASLAGRKRILTRPGSVTHIVGGQAAVIFKTHSMHALQLTGGSDVWRLDDISASVGTEFPSSVVECSDGVRRFWGGDDFYEQQDLSPPVAIGNEGIKSLLLDANARASMYLLPLVPGGLPQFDVNLFGANEENLRCAFWFYKLLNQAGANRAVVYNYALRKWASLVFPDTALLTCACTSRSRISFFNHNGRIVVGRLNENGDGAYATFTSETHYAITLATQRFSLGADQGSGTMGGKTKVRGVLPIVTLNQATTSPDYRMAAIPSTTAVRAVAANDQLWKQQTDADGTQISPRSESRTMADANSWGWLNYAAIIGTSMLLEMTIPESTTAVRGLPGCWVEYEVVP